MRPPSPKDLTQLHTLQATALVNEAYLRMEWKNVQWQNLEVLKISPRTVKRKWSLAQAWL
jgi:hypothetical protein